jgi:hypothetical protein
MRPLRDGRRFGGGRGGATRVVDDAVVTVAPPSARLLYRLALLLAVFAMVVMTLCIDLMNYEHDYCGRRAVVG